MTIHATMSSGKFEELVPFSFVKIFLSITDTTKFSTSEKTKTPENIHPFFSELIYVLEWAHSLQDPIDMIVRDTWIAE